MPVSRQRIIGERIRTARSAAHLTQQELADQLYSKSYISAIERAKMVPSLQALERLAVRLHMPVSYLLGEDTRGNDTLAQEAQARAAEQARLLADAEEFLHQGRYAEAIAGFEQMGRQDRASGAHEQYARFLAAQGRFQDAYEQMRLAHHAEQA